MPRPITMPNPIRIRSNGTPEGTRIEVRDREGEWMPLPGVLEARIEIAAGTPTVRLTVINPELDIEAADVVKEPAK